MTPRFRVASLPLAPEALPKTHLFYTLVHSSSTFCLEIKGGAKSSSRPERSGLMRNISSAVHFSTKIGDWT